MMPFRRFQSGRFHWTSIAVVLRITTWKEVGGPVGSVREGEGREYHEGGTGVRTLYMHIRYSCKH